MSPLEPAPEVTPMEAVALMRETLREVPGWYLTPSGGIRTRHYISGTYGGCCPLEAVSRERGKTLPWLSAGDYLGLSRRVASKIATAADTAYDFKTSPLRKTLLEACGLLPETVDSPA